MNNTITEKEIQRNREEQDALWKICGELAEYHEELKYQTALPDEVEMLERDRISDALAKTEGNQSKAAKLLKIGRTNLIAKMKKYDFPFISSQ
jgi:transcriptional regulator with GAF, ATPase, and Fis domain